MGPKNRPANEKKSYFCWWRKSWLFFLITLFMNMKNWTILLFSGSLSKICCTKLDLLQDIRKFYGALFDVHGFLKYERRHQSVAFNSLATQWVKWTIWMMVVLRSPIHANEDYDLYSVVKYSVGCAVEHAFVFTWLICMNGTSQYHHYFGPPYWEWQKAVGPALLSMALVC